MVQLAGAHPLGLNPGASLFPGGSQFHLEAAPRTEVFKTRGEPHTNLIMVQKGLWKSPTPTSHARGAMGIMLVYGISNAKSFENISKWRRNIDEVRHTHTHTHTLCLTSSLCRPVVVSVEAGSGELLLSAGLIPTDGCPSLLPLDRLDPALSLHHHEPACCT